MTAPVRRSPTTMTANELVPVRRQDARIEELETALGFYASGLCDMTRFDAYGAFTADVLEDGGMLARQVLRAGKDGD